MAFSVVTNVASLAAQRNLAQTQDALAKSMARLSSGLRINSASDDAAGLGISEKLRAQTRGLQQASRNAMDGVSLLQTAEGSLNEVSNILGRMRELALSASTDTNAAQRSFVNDEYTALGQELDRLANVTEFNGTKLLNGDAADLDIQVGINNSADDHINVAIDSMSAADMGLDGTVLTKDDALAALSTIDTAIDTVTGARANLGALQNRLQITISNLSSSNENLTAANSRIRDVDVAEETASMTRSSILMQAGVAVLAQANQAPSMALSLLK